MRMIPMLTDRGRARVRAAASPARALLAVAVLIATVACATHKHATTMSDHFIRQGKPSVDLGGPKPDESSLQRHMQEVRTLSATAMTRSKASSTSESAEHRDPLLRDALKALAAHPSAAAHRTVASEYRRLRIYDAAFEHLTAAIKLDPKDAAAYDLRARLWRRWRLPALGLKDARQAVKLAPDSATAWNTLGLLFEDSGDSERATRAYLRSIGKEARASYAWNNLCRTWTAGADAHAAERACGRALQLDPALEAARLNLERAEHLLNDRSFAPDNQAETRSGPDSAVR